MISQAYPLAKQQRCFIHISRNLASKVKRSDRAVILEQFKMIDRSEKTTCYDRFRSWERADL